MTPRKDKEPISPSDDICWIKSTVKVKRGYWLTLADGERVFCWNKGISYASDFRYRVMFARRPNDDRVFVLEESNE